MLFFMIWICVFSVLVCDSNSAPLKKILSIRHGDYEYNFRYKLKEDCTHLHIFPMQLYKGLNNTIWAGGAESGCGGPITNLTLFTDDGTVLGKGKPVQNFVGFDSCGYYYTHSGRSRGYYTHSRFELRKFNYQTDYSGLPNYEPLKLKWPFVYTSPDTIELTLFRNRPPQPCDYPRMKAVHLQDDYFLIATQYYTTQYMVFDLAGQFITYVPFYYWTKKGVGASIDYESDTLRAMFYVARGNSPADRIQSGSQYTEREYSLPARFRFLGLDSLGRGYFYAETDETKRIKIELVRYNPHEFKEEIWTGKIKAGKGNRPLINDQLLLPNGSVIISAVQPRDKWQYIDRRLSFANNLWIGIDTLIFREGEPYDSTFYIQKNVDAPSPYLKDYDQYEVIFWKCQFDD